MKELMIMYHSVKKEIRFLDKVRGEYLEIPYQTCPHLARYSPEFGEFLLQNQGNRFFDDIWEQFSRDKINLTFKGTRIDYEDFVEKVNAYNKTSGEVRFELVNFIELPSVVEIYNRISEFCDETLNVFDKELVNSEIRTTFQVRKN